MKKITLLIVLCFAFTNAQTILYTTDLSSPGINDYQSWKGSDNDGDGFGFGAYYFNDNSFIGFMSHSKNLDDGTPLTPTNSLITPEFDIPSNASEIVLTVDVYSFGDAFGANYEESFYPVIFIYEGDNTEVPVPYLLTENLQTFPSTGLFSLDFNIPDSFRGYENVSAGIIHTGSTGKESMAVFNAQISYGNELSNNENELTEMISVYPVPASEYITINTSLNIDRAKIVNQLGQVVLTTNDLNLKKIDISTLKNGVYSLLIKSGNKSKTLRFVKN